MIHRCYNTKYKASNITYEGCSVQSEWLLLSNFKEWMCSQQWQGNTLDKDLLVRGNKLYSESTCVFISSTLNSLLVERQLARDRCIAGVTEVTTGYIAATSNPNGSNYLGIYKTEIEAHNAWRVAKAAKYIEASKLESDQRVVDALVTRANELLVLITP